MSALLHPRIIASWGTAKWLVGWVIPALWALAVDRYLRQVIVSAGALLLACLVFAVTMWAVGMYVEQLVPPADLSEGGALVVMVLWTIPVDVACAVISLLPVVGPIGTLALWVAGSLACGATVILSRLGVITPPSALPSSGALAAICVAAGFAASLLLAGQSVPAVVLVLTVLVSVVFLAATSLDGGRPVADLDADIAAVGLDAFIQRCRLVDGPCPTPGHPESLPQALYAVPREYGAVKLAHVVNGSINPETGKYEYRHLKVPAACRTIRDAVAWSYSVPASSYVPERRT